MLIKGGIMASRKRKHPPRSRRDELRGTAVFVHSTHNFRRIRYRTLIRNAAVAERAVGSVRAAQVTAA